MIAWPTQESSQRFYKQRDEQAVEYVADGKVIGKEIRYAAETEQMDRDGPPENPSDWDSLSDRVRKARRHQKTLLQHHRGMCEPVDMRYTNDTCPYLFFVCLQKPF